MVISRIRAPQLWGLALIALHLACAHSPGGQEATLEMLDEAPEPLLSPQLGEAQSLFRDANATLSNSTNSTGAKPNRPLQSVLAKMQAKKTIEAQKSIAKATADEAKAKAEATKAILKKEVKGEKKQAAAIKSEMSKVEAVSKDTNSTNIDELSMLKARARSNQLKLLYSQQVLVAEKAKEYTHKVAAGSKEAKQAGATLEQMKHTNTQALPHRLEDKVSERVLKAKNRLSKHKGIAAKAVRVPSSWPQKEKKELPSNAAGQEEPAAKAALDAAMNSAKANPTPQALKRVQALTAQLKTADAHDAQPVQATPRPTASKEDLKIEKLIKKDHKGENFARQELELSSMKAKRKAKHQRRENALEEVQKEEKDRKKDFKLEKMLENAKVELEMKQLKEKLEETRSKSGLENAKLVERERAKNIKSKEVNLKASARANELENKKAEENRESEEKRLIVNKEKAKEKADEETKELKETQKKMKKVTRKEIEFETKEKAKMTKAAEAAAKTEDPDVITITGLSQTQLQTKLLDQEKATDAVAKKATQKARDTANDETQQLQRKTVRLQKKIMKEKRIAVKDGAKADALRANDEAVLQQEKNSQFEREKEQYKEKLMGKAYRENLKQKLIMELKEEVRQEVYGPYKAKIQAEFRAKIGKEPEIDSAGLDARVDQLATHHDSLSARVEQLAKHVGLSARVDLSARVEQLAKVEKEQKQEIQELSQPQTKKGIAVSGMSPSQVQEKLQEQAKAGKMPELGEPTSQEQDVATVRSLAYAAAADAASRAAEAAAHDVEAHERSDPRDTEKTAFSWEGQQNYWDRHDALKVHEEAAAQGARAAVQDRAARSAVKHLIQTLNTADGVYDQKKKQEAGYYVKAKVVDDTQYVGMKDGWRAKLKKDVANTQYVGKTDGWEMKPSE